jgi:hypothetical protein
MSRPYETSLSNQLARLNHLIAESEAFVSRSTDSETIGNLNEEMTRQRELRARCENALRRTKFLNRFALRAQIAFWVSFSMLFVIGFLGPFGEKLVVLLGISVFLLLVVSAASFIGAILVRDVVARDHRPWQFSLHSMLAAITVIAVLLSLLFIALRD